MISMNMTTTKNHRATRAAVKAGLSQWPQNQGDGAGMTTGRERARTVEAVGFQKTVRRGDSSEQ